VQSDTYNNIKSIVESSSELKNLVIFMDWSYYAYLYNVRV
jgi:hypothetical protein